MANVARTWLPATLILAAAGASALAHGSLPEMVSLNFEQVLPLTGSMPGRLAHRGFALLTVPVLGLALWLALEAARTRAGGGQAYDTIVVGLLLLCTGFHAAVLAAALQHPLMASRLLAITLGVSLVVIGSVMPGLRANWVAGLRTQRLMRDPELWRAAHRVLGRAFVGAGLVTMLMALAAPRYALVTGIAGIIASLVVASLKPVRRETATAVAIAVLTGTSAAGAQSMSRSPIAPETRDSVHETPFSFVRGTLELKGTLAEPAARTPATPVVLIVAGSGPTDRNGNGPGVNSNAYAMLALQLAQHGIASFRYDKRGIGESGVTNGDPTKLSMDDYVADVGAAAAALRASGRFSTVFLLGHSEGAGLVLMAANRGTPSAGVIMIAGQGRPLVRLLHDQFALQVDSGTLVRVDTAIAKYLRGEDIADAPAIVKPLLAPALRNYFRSWAAYDPAAEARRLEVPLLVMRGTTDIQVTQPDADAIVRAQPRATFVSLPGVNHVMKEFSSMDPAAHMANYRDPRQPLAPIVPASLIAWLNERRR